MKKRAEEDITSGCEEHKLVKSEAFSSSFNDSGSCGFGESKSSDSDLGNIKESDIISDGADDDSDSISIAMKQEGWDDISQKFKVAYLFSPRCLTRREREIGGLLTLEAMSLLTMVLAKTESVLLARNLNNYRAKEGDWNQEILCNKELPGLIVSSAFDLL